MNQSHEIRKLPIACRLKPIRFQFSNVKINIIGSRASRKERPFILDLFYETLCSVNSLSKYY